MLRQLSLALRQIGSQQANALEEVRRRRKREFIVFAFFFTLPSDERQLFFVFLHPFLTFPLSLLSLSLSFQSIRPLPSSTPQPRQGSS